MNPRRRAVVRVVLAGLLLAGGCAKRDELPPSVRSSKATVTAELPNILSVAIIGPRRVRLTAAPTRGLTLLDSQGALVMRLQYIDADTGAVRPRPGQLAHEVTLSPGETCRDSVADWWNDYLLVEVRDGRVVFHHTGFQRNGAQIDRMIEVAPYVTPPGLSGAG